MFAFPYIYLRSFVAAVAAVGCVNEFQMVEYQIQIGHHSPLPPPPSPTWRKVAALSPPPAAERWTPYHTLLCAVRKRARPTFKYVCRRKTMPAHTAINELHRRCRRRQRHQFALSPRAPVQVQEILLLQSARATDYRRRRQQMRCEHARISSTGRVWKNVAVRVKIQLR